MRSFGLLLSAGLMLTACGGLVQDTADELARAQARSAIDAEMDHLFPGVDVSPLTDCVIDNASAQEIVTIAGGVALGDGGLASETIGVILRRPETAACAAEAYAADILGGLL